MSSNTIAFTTTSLEYSKYSLSIDTCPVIVTVSCLCVGLIIPLFVMMLVLLEVKYTSELNGSEFVNKTVTKKLADIISNEEYEEVTEETMSKTIEDPITLNLDETYFESVIITEKSFFGKINSEKVEEVIGIKNAGSVEIRIELTDDLKVNTIEIKYTDLGSGYLVTMKSKYTF